MKYHPDRNPRQSEGRGKLQEAKEAYEVLTDEQASRLRPLRPRRRRCFGGRCGRWLRRLLRRFRRHLQRHLRRLRRSRSTVFRRRTCATTSRSASKTRRAGTETRIRIPALEECEDVQGTGAKPGTQPTQCTTCHGHGQVRMQQGFFSIQQTFARCHGTGKMIQTPASRAKARGA